MALPQNGEHRDPVLPLIVVRSTRDPGQLTIRVRDDLVDGGEISRRLAAAGFEAGDLVELRREGA